MAKQRKLLRNSNGKFNVNGGLKNTNISDGALQTILDVSPVGILVFNHEERVIYANHLAEEIFGKKLTDPGKIRCGDYIDCPNRHGAARGCGHTPSCPNCVLYDAIHSAIVDDNKPFSTNPIETLLDRESPLSPIWIKFKVTPVKLGGKRCVILSVDDITERKADEQKLKGSLAELSAIHESAPISMMVVDRDRRIRKVNGVTALFAGRPTEEMIGMKGGEALRCLHHLEAPEGCGYGPHCNRCRIRTAVLDTFTSGRGVQNLEQWLPFPKGGGAEERCLLISTSLLHLDDPERVLVCAQDITERVLAEKKLKESQSNLNSLIENADDIMVLRDLEGHAIVYNQAFDKIVRLLFDVEAKHGLRTLDYLPGGIKEHWEDKLSEVHRGVPHQEEYAWEVEGVLRYYETSHNPIKVGDKIVGSTEITRDITNRKVSDKKIHDMAKRLDLATRAAGLGIWDWDIPNDILVWDDRMYELYGIHKDDFSNAYDTWLNGLHPDDREENDRISELARRGECEYDTDFRIVYPDGSIRFIKALGQVFRDSDDTPIRMTGINYDITEKKEMEALIQQAQKMEAIGNLAGGIAHDFNNLLFPIVGLAEMLMEDMPKESPEYENVEEIYTAAKRGSNLVAKILSFSRQTKEEKAPIRIQEILHEVLKLSRASIPSNINIQMEIQENCGLVMADSGQIHQVAMNLITNAYHAVEDNGGTITVGLKGPYRFSNDIVREPLLSEKNVMLTVSDTGCGIDPAVIGKIFEPYFTTKPKGKGTGLGLSVVYGIVKEHGGDIQVSSRPGEGTTFTVFLPLMAKPSASVNSDVPEVLYAGDERILLVDDEAPIVRLVTLMLERLGYEVISRTSSVDALEAFRATPDRFDLVITDMTMPNMTGDQLARGLLAIKPDIPIIICTGFSDKVDESIAKSIGIKGFLMKPVVKSEMAETIRILLDKAKH